MLWPQGEPSEEEKKAREREREADESRVLAQAGWGEKHNMRFPKQKKIDLNLTKLAEYQGGGGNEFEQKLLKTIPSSEAHHRPGSPRNESATFALSASGVKRRRRGRKSGGRFSLTCARLAEREN